MSDAINKESREITEKEITDKERIFALKTFRENKELKEQLERATKRLSLPIKKIRGDGFIELMAELRKIK